MFGEKLAVPHIGTLTRATLRAEFIELEAGKRLFCFESMLSVKIPFLFTLCMNRDVDR